MKIVHGVDIVEVARVQAMLRESRALETFLDLGWTEREQVYSAGSAERLAARWAAKEATMKALGQGIGPLSLTEIEVMSDGGAPTIRLSGTALDRASELSINAWILSMTHEGGMALASVIGISGDNCD